MANGDLATTQAALKTYCGALVGDVAFHGVVLGELDHGHRAHAVPLMTGIQTDSAAAAAAGSNVNTAVGALVTLLDARYAAHA